MAWSKRQGKLLFPLTELDRTLEQYADHLYFRGRGVTDLRYAAWGYGFLRDVALSKGVFPCTYAALRGWRRAAPDVQRDPMPWSAVILISHLLASDRGAPEGSLEAARALPLQWDTYMRPSEVLELRVDDLLAPRRVKGEWAVVIRSSGPCREGSLEDLKKALNRNPAGSPPSKATMTAQSLCQTLLRRMLVVAGWARCCDVFPDRRVLASSPSV